MKSIFSSVCIITFSCIIINSLFAQKTPLNLSSPSRLSNLKIQLKPPVSKHTGKVIAEIIGTTTEDENENEKFDDLRKRAELEFEKTKDIGRIEHPQDKPDW